MIRSDNGREFTSTNLRDWLFDQGVTPVFVAKASPQQTCYIERFTWEMRDEIINGESQRDLTEARVLINQWVDSYNNDRPHMSLGMQTPAAYAATQIGELASTSERGE